MFRVPPEQKVKKIWTLQLSGHEFEVQQIGKTTDESSYMIGRYDTDTDTNLSVQLFGQEIQNMGKKEMNERRHSKLIHRR